jgi:hypothetical protein
MAVVATLGSATYPKITFEIGHLSIQIFPLHSESSSGWARIFFACPRRTDFASIAVLIF